VTDEWLDTIVEHHPELLMLDISKGGVIVIIIINIILIGYRIKSQGVQKVIDKLLNLNSLVLNKCKLVDDEAFIRLSSAY